MKKRAFSFFTALTLAVVMFSGCGGDGGKTESTPAPTTTPQEAAEQEQLLDSGTYAVYDATDAVVAYLKVSKRWITAYDGDGKQYSEDRYSYDSATGVYSIADTAAFTLVQERRDLVMTTLDDDIFKGLDKGDYFLETIEEDAIPGAVATPEPTETPEPTDTPSPTQEPAAGNLLKPGSYAFYDGDGDIVVYMTFTRNMVTIFDYDGEAHEPMAYNYDPDESCYYVGEDYTLTAERRDGQLYVNDGDDEYLVNEIGETDIPEYQAWIDESSSHSVTVGDHTLYFALPNPLYENLEERDGEIEAYFEQGASMFMFTGRWYVGDKLQEMRNMAEAAGYETSPEGIFAYEYSTMEEELKSTFSEVGIEEPSFNTYTEDLFNVEWRVASMYGGYGSDQTLDFYYHFYMDDNIFIEMVVGSLVTSENGTYDAEYERFLSGRGWLYQVSESYDLR